MNAHTIEIMKILGCDAEYAMKVQDNMQIDFSECTNAQFRRCVLRTDKELCEAK